MTDKEAFEAWRKTWKQQYVFNSDGSGFKDSRQRIEWDAWQAACAWQREQDAGICDEIMKECFTGHGRYEFMGEGAQECAIAIRKGDE